MTHLAESIEIRAPLDRVFAYAVNYRNAPKFIASVTSYDPTTEAHRGVGARFAMDVKILDFRFTQELEVVELQWGKLLHVRSISGQPFSEAWWRFEPTPTGTLVTYELTYAIPEIFLGRQIDEETKQRIDSQIRADAKQSLFNLKEQIEGS